MMMDNEPLKIQLEGEQLVLRIGLDTLAHAAQWCLSFYDDDKHCHGGPYITVVDKMELARDVVRMLNKEEEDGSSPLTYLFDQAFVDASDDGSLAFGDNQ